MIISAYAGVGKSSVKEKMAKRGIKVIDLDSYIFKKYIYSGDDWERVYSQLAINLHLDNTTIFSESGDSEDKVVIFVSTHPKVIENFSMFSFYGVIYPDISLKDQWVASLQSRYNRTKDEKDLKALRNAQDNFEYMDDIREMCLRHNIPSVRIQNMNYQLTTLVDNLLKETENA